MTDAKHTPGPWFVREIGGLTEICEVIAPDAWVVAPTIRLRDAHLIAAAPDMLAALKLLDAFGHEEEKSGDDMLWTDHFLEVFEVARAAIAKATSQ